MTKDSRPILVAVPDTAETDAGPSEEAEATLPTVAFDEAVRMVEAMLFVSDGPLAPKLLEQHVGAVLADVVDHLKKKYESGGVNLIELAGGYALRTASDLSYLFEEQAVEPKKLSRAALETLAIIAYHQPVTRAEIEDIRGVSASKGTLDVLLETGWARMRGRRRTPGRPVTYGTTPAFLDQFTLASIGDLPGLDELKGAGLLEAIPQGAMAAMPTGDADQLSADEDPLDDEDAEAERSAMALWPQEELTDENADTTDERGADG
ncbi:MAG: SMC-Scp complex subunit ScpB [Rhizobiales bacterium]|nr:SMC-Scp complex subunit ScpB [Hyphomicrobiales bacterium]MBO6698402.1 SMC-Scp complex subunit ScpB [Hyphomicrobiales bacterium]MBO6735344.1 SMC-Scp complex subunit ScpB [Hyphomicrobiales bacterium]MBO6910848.1 SMC-Scp complex subunit ScpB [Hyphomicrobiales bacterium]MBO6955904.1 SMC-Scp complex subunit ScpB [Hyphomicrobiales bacterium]